MSLIIDGYNLLHASGILGRGIGPGGLERSRHALLNFLAESLPESEASRTTVVFDAAHAPPGLSRSWHYRGLAVRFSDAPGCADTTIEQLIKLDSAPKRLTVVSSDHRLQRAAKRRRATAVDSDRWFIDLIRQRNEPKPKPPTIIKPGSGLSESEVNYWLRQFGEEPVSDLSADDANPASTSAEPNPYYPFPPGYGEDVVE